MKQEVIAPIDKQLNESLEAPKLDPIILSVANQYIEGTSIPDIADNFDIDADVISQIIDKKEVKTYIDNVFLSQGYMSRIKRMKIIEQVMNAKLQEALETQEWTKKDLLDWLKHIAEVERDIKPKTQNPTVAVQVNNNYTELIKDLLK